MHLQPNHTKQPIIYIAGYGRSGSTILDIMLGNNSTIISLGEVANIFAMLAENKQAGCACGSALRLCSFWAPVITVVEQSVAVDWQYIVEIQRKVERWYGVFYLAKDALLFGSNEPSLHKEYADFLNLFLEAIVDIHGCHILVDSSKTTWWTTLRPVFLRRWCGRDVRVIHMIRDGRAVMWAGYRGTNKELAHKKRKPSLIRAFKTIINWGLVNLMTSILLFFFFDSKDVTTVHYETFLSKPAQKLQNLAHLFDLELEQSIMDVQEKVPLVVGHLVAGNRLALRKKVRLRFDEEWRNQLPLVAHVLFWLTLWPVALWSHIVWLKNGRL